MDPNVPELENVPNVDMTSPASDETAEAVLDAESVEIAEPANEAEKITLSAPTTKEEIIERAKDLLARDAADISRDEVSRLRGLFATLTKADSVKADDETTEVEAAVVDEAPEDQEFKALINAIKEKKAAYLAELEARRATNLERKNAIIAEILTLADDTDNVNKTFDRYRELQSEFNAVGEVPAPEETSVWKRFQEARERYSDNLKINKELRDYDFKKNLEQKELLIAEATKLSTEEKDIITAFRRLQELHNKWREIGPVAKEIREEVWARFKDASLDINKRYQAFFEERKAREAENEAGKTAICERVEAYDFSLLSSFNDWEKMTANLKEAQEEWKKFGFASRKMNNALFNRFRATCDTFFVLKAAYYKNIKEQLAANLAAKNALADEAEALKDSTDWKKTSDRMVAMQKEWKAIGAVPKKNSDAVWNRFQSACDYFFAQKKSVNSGQRQTEQANLQAKRDLIKELDKITDETPKDEARALIADLQERWKSIGHVPFREKDKVYEAFRNRINEVRGKYDLAARRESMDRFENSLADMRDDSTRLNRERDRQVRLLETRRAELRTYENNLGFLNAKSKSGNSLVRDFERKIENLKADIKGLEEKIRLLDNAL